MNKLENEKSLFLQQHADNPVKWYPWAQEAFDIAKKNDKPVILSIENKAYHEWVIAIMESLQESGFQNIQIKTYTD